jgi:hypothetical protein
VHPFVGGGVELVRERHTADALPAEAIRFSTVNPSVRLPPLPAIDSVTYSGPCGRSSLAASSST